MKTLIFRGAMAAALAIMLGGVLLAADFHTGASLLCSDCHVMHYNQSHGYQSTGGGSFTPLGAGGPFTYLLRDDVNDLCLSCHDNGGGAPDVFENNTSVFFGDPRSAGALNRDNVAPYFDATGHTLGSTDTAPGGTFANADGLECTDCHNPHGYGAATANPYRNLAGNITVGFGPSVSYVNVTNNATFDVFQRAVGDYSVGNVDLNEPNTADSAFGNWCGQCHSDFHGLVGDANMGGVGVPAEEFLRHPTAGVDIGAIGGGHSNLDVFTFGTDDTTSPDYGTKVNFVRVMSPGGVWPVNGTAPASLPADLTPTCLTCHKGHGNTNAFGLIYMEKTGAVTEDGTATGSYVDLCHQCHVQGE